MNWSKFKKELVTKHQWSRVDWEGKNSPIGKWYASPTRDIAIYRTHLWTYDVKNKTSRCFCKLPNPIDFTEVFLDPVTKCAYYMIGGSRLLALDIS